MLTPIIQRQALDIPPATLFAFQILLGVVFGIWGLALALPLMAIVKVRLDGGDQIVTSSVTKDAALDLGLQAGQAATVFIKSTEVTIGVE